MKYLVYINSFGDIPAVDNLLNVESSEITF